MSIVPQLGFVSAQEVREAALTVAERARLRRRVGLSTQQQNAAKNISFWYTPAARVAVARGEKSSLEQLSSPAGCAPLMPPLTDKTKGRLEAAREQIAKLIQRDAKVKDETDLYNRLLKQARANEALFEPCDAELPLHKQPQFMEAPGGFAPMPAALKQAATEQLEYHMCAAPRCLEPHIAGSRLAAGPRAGSSASSPRSTARGSPSTTCSSSGTTTTRREAFTSACPALPLCRRRHSAAHAAPWVGGGLQVRRARADDHQRGAGALQARRLCGRGDAAPPPPPLDAVRGGGARRLPDRTRRQQRRRGEGGARGGRGPVTPRRDGRRRGGLDDRHPRDRLRRPVRRRLGWLGWACWRETVP